MLWWSAEGDDKTAKVIRVHMQIIIIVVWYIIRCRKMNSAANRIASPVVIKSNPVFQYCNDENVSQLLSGKPRSREEDLKMAILELAQLGK